jgi:thiamine biosynthesis lipoprotein
MNRLGTLDPDTICASGDTRLLLDRARAAHHITDGRFNPYELGALTAAGYDRFYATPDRASTAGYGDQSQLPPTAGFDPGGIGKGLAADLVAEELIDRGASGALVNLGGDLRVIGRSPQGDGWRVEVEDPTDARTLTVVELESGAVATSSPVRRRWLDEDGVSHHHLIDPATGRSSTSRVVSVTVVAAAGWQAEVLCKPLLIDWHDSQHSAVPDPAALVDRVGAAGLVNLGTIAVPTRNWHRFERATAAA